jgi:hypothetical protein
MSNPPERLPCKLTRTFAVLGILLIARASFEERATSPESAIPEVRD